MKASLTLALILAGIPSLSADPLACGLADYKALPGLTASTADNALTLAWDGDQGQELRLRFTLNNGVPTLRDLAVRRKGGAWNSLASGVTPEFRIVSGKRRMSNQQMEPLKGLNIDITPAVIDKEKWEAFWDAPLDVPGLPPGRQAGFSGNLPPDLPRSPSEIHRASAAFHVTGCEVKTNGARLEVSFPGVDLGVFSGRLQYTVYRGANLIRQEIIASTSQPSVAYKYDAGLKGMPILPASKVAWRDLSSAWQDYRFGGAPNENEVALKASNRLLIAEAGPAGSLAVFPPPHTFFWAREIETNLGYNWYRKDTDASFSFGIRQAEREESPQYQGNFALYSAPPGSLQRMAVYFYASAAAAQATLAPVMAFTHGDRYKPLPGYQVMAHHYHMDLGERLLQAKNLDAEIPDLEAIKALGINIVSQLSSIILRTGPAREGAPDPLKVIAASVEGARRHSDKGFLVMPDQEYFNSPVGGHTDLLFSHPVYWEQRAPGQPFVEENPAYGKVYHVGGAADLMEMARREDVLVNMPHPRTKGSTGYPDAVKDTSYFKDPDYQGVGFRWGMGLDLSEQRLCDHRCLNLLDDMSNWMADQPVPLKYLLAITETRYKAPGDDVYAASPVNYVKTGPDPSPAEVVKVLKQGDYFLTTGEVLIDEYAVSQSAVTADIQWTFPLEFVEVVWGDGKSTGRKIIPATELGAFGKHRFQIPFNGAGQKWVRFAAWDSAGNGAIAQPVRLRAR